MKVDYHVHPNLYGKHPGKRLATLWKAFERHSLDAVICAEHSFKEPAESYRALIASRPKGARTVIFPGAELVARDGKGVDVIAFCDHDWYDEHPLLLEPYGMTLAEMLRYLRDSELHYFIPHPMIVGSTLKSLYPTVRSMQEFLDSVPAFEAFNSTLLLLEHLFQLPILRPALRKIRHHFRRSAQVDLATYDRENKHEFLAIGSDAHHAWEIGFSVEIPGKRPASHKAIFERITTNTDVRTLHFPHFDRVTVRLIAMAWTALNEAMVRRLYSSKAARQAEFVEDSLELETELH